MFYLLKPCSNQHYLLFHIAILISSSGSSFNIINAVKYVKNNGIYIITFLGFNKNNPHNQLSNIKFWADSKSYNYD